MHGNLKITDNLFNTMMSSKHPNLVRLHSKKETNIRYHSSIRDQVMDIKDGIVITRRHYDKMPSDFELIKTMIIDLWDGCVIKINEWDTTISIIGGVVGITLLYFAYRSYKKSKIHEDNATNTTGSKYNKVNKNIDNRGKSESTSSSCEHDYSSGSDSDTN